MFLRRNISLTGAALVIAVFIYEYAGHFGSCLFSVIVCCFALICCLYMKKDTDKKAGSVVFCIMMIICLALCQVKLVGDARASDAAAELAEREMTVTGTICDIDIKARESVSDTGQASQSASAEAGSATQSASAEAGPATQSASAEAGPSRNETSKREKACYMEVLIDDIDGNPAGNRKMLITTNGDADGFALSDRIEARGTVRLPEQARNPNTFDYSRYLRTKGIYTTMKSEEIRRVGYESSGILRTLFLLKRNYIKRLEAAEGEETAALMSGILFGEKGRLSEETTEVFQKNGTAHILAVSGLHVGMLYAVFLRIWTYLSAAAPGLFGRKRDGRFFVCAAVLFSAYGILSGFTPSVVRAVLMVLLHSFAGVTGRYYDLQNAAVAVGICSLIHCPMILFQSGFQLSYLAVMSLALVVPYMRRFFSGGLLAGVSIQLGLLPYFIYQFNWLSLISVLINIPVIFMASVIVPLGVASFVLFSTADAVSIPGVYSAVDLMDTVNSMVCHIMVNMNSVCSVENLTVVRVPSPHAGFVIGFYMAVIAFLSETGRMAVHRVGRRYVTAAILLVVMISAGGGFILDGGYRNMDTVFVDVGQGDCIHLRVKGGRFLRPGGDRNYLIDGGGSDRHNTGKKTLKPYLLKNGVRTIDGAFVSHLHTDHYKGVCELAREGMIERIYVYEANKLKLDQICSDTGLEPYRVVFLHAGQTVSLGGGAKEGGRDTGSGDIVEVMWPEKKPDDVYAEMIRNEEDENASSLILRAKINGVSILATGDMGEDGEKQLIDYLAGGRDGDMPANRSVDTVTGFDVSDSATYASQREWPLHADILKVGHHGSKYSSSEEFLAAVNPMIAVIQVGKGNTYGHPTPEVLSRLAHREVPVFRNDLQGAIGLKFQAGRIVDLKQMIREDY